jgi:hypothetical protein
LVLATNKGGRDVPGEAKQRGLEATLHTGAELEAVPAEAAGFPPDLLARIPRLIKPVARAQRSKMRNGTAGWVRTTDLRFHKPAL